MQCGPFAEPGRSTELDSEGSRATAAGPIFLQLPTLEARQKRYHHELREALGEPDGIVDGKIL